MTWTKLDDNHFDEPTVLRLSRSARLLDLEALVYSNKMLTDGHVPSEALRRITDADDPMADAAELVKVGRWEDADGGWRIVAFSAAEGGYQPTRDEVEQRRAVDAHRQARWRKHNNGDHSLCDPERCKVLLSRRDKGVSSTVTNAYPSRPDPSRPDPQGGTGRGRGDGPSGSGASLGVGPAPSAVSERGRPPGAPPNGRLPFNWTAPDKLPKPKKTKGGAA